MSDSDEEEMLQYKIILLGDGTVGKTAISTRFTNDTFGQQYKQVTRLQLERVFACKAQRKFPRDAPAP